MILNIVFPVLPGDVATAFWPWPLTNHLCLFDTWQKLTEEKYEVTSSLPEVAILVQTTTEPKLTLKITLTSPAMREDDDEEEEEEEEEVENEEEGEEEREEKEEVEEEEEEQEMKNGQGRNTAINCVFSPFFPFNSLTDVDTRHDRYRTHTSWNTKLVKSNSSLPSPSPHFHG